MSIEQELRSARIDFEDTVLLSDHCLMGVGGRAKYFVREKSLSRIVDLVKLCKTIELPYKILGSGSNIIPSDSGFDGLVIKNESFNISLDAQRSKAIVDSGVHLSKFILELASGGMSGLEPLYGIPGTVGGALINNAGAHGVSIFDFVRSVTVFDKEEIKTYDPDWFGAEYRKTKLKGLKSDTPIVLSIIFQFNKRKQEEITSDLSKYKAIRQENQPLGIKTSGSIFRNPSGSDLLSVKDAKYRTAGYLLESVGAKKMSVGGARVTKKHANWIENFNQATARDVRKLIDKMREAVREKYNITLEEEVEYLGGWDAIS